MRGHDFQALRPLRLPIAVTSRGSGFCTMNLVCTSITHSTLLHLAAHTIDIRTITLAYGLPTSHLRFAVQNFLFLPNALIPHFSASFLPLCFTVGITTATISVKQVIGSTRFENLSKFLPIFTVVEEPLS